MSQPASPDSQESRAVRLGSRPGAWAPGRERSLLQVTEHDIYLCGPPGMTASVRRALHELGVGDADIHEEMFAF